MRNHKGDGVYFDKHSSKWRAHYSPEGKIVYLGQAFNTYKEALAARKAAMATESPLLNWRRRLEAPTMDWTGATTENTRPVWSEHAYVPD
jgi:AP2 domain